MKLFGVMMVRNEADIIEASVRHNLASLDRLVVIDHGSFDGTLEILKQLAGEGLPLSIIGDTSIEFRQSDRITRVVRGVIQRDAADFVFTFDADEFLKLASRASLEEELRLVPPGMHTLLHWQTYVPDDLASDAAIYSPSGTTHRLKTERHTLHKVVVAKHFAQSPREAVADGNHLVWNVDQPGVMPLHARIPLRIAALAHVPVRSRRQLETKIVIGYLAHLASHPGSAHTAYHWRDIYQEIRAGKELDAARLREIACNYSLPRDKWLPVDAIELVADPFATAGEPRYRSEAGQTALQLLMRFCERLVAAKPAAG